MAHLNGTPEWISARKHPPKPNTIVYGFFNPEMEDNGFTVHIRPVTYIGPGRWRCSATGHDLSTSPVVYSLQMPYPSRQFVHEVMEDNANLVRQGYLEMVPNGEYPKVHVPFPAY
ncbi:hypothetical protein [Stenotrophomonas sp. GD03657]|uniref:hypothetical protein n=1 Tax=Stenotrophomonas sp. GD03657 TaxID=2975363 RepID=UPI00244D0255|nr:hypothetical protein [Stenotrophomonas sp. GD03657]MDH2154070.1 hypothetical protein [Stenotrophomonas sp. GD03657]